jgi:RHS repeat-associated protein
VASNIFEATSFLYSGNNPIQTGVVSGTIQLQQAAVLRGRVLGLDGSKMAGVTITILNHPEYGQTVTRTDGAFDLAVNGGGSLTINYARDGFLPAQRQVTPRWQDYTWVKDVILVQPDSRVTTINVSSSSAMQVARGNSVSDNSGPRQATVLFPAGTTATMTLANGVTSTLTSLSVRATEYTVGANGPMAMPADLPPTSGYTYAVSLTSDEAIAANATSVQFSQPVPFYLENFLNFPVGSAVPTGAYDPTQGQWLPASSGVVVKVLSVQNNSATLDVDGSGNPASSSQLTALGITTAELNQIASLYAPGQTLWRVLIGHFSIWDCNWGTGPLPIPSDTPVGGNPTPEPGPSPYPTPPWDPCPEKGSIIECQSQTLGETVGVTGTSYHLTYRSDRVPGRSASNTIPIQLTGPSLLGPVIGVDLEVDVAGQQFTQSFPPAPNLTYSYVWNGLDGYGRPVQGSQAVKVLIAYTYAPGYYVETPAFGESFAQVGYQGTATQHFSGQLQLAWYTTVSAWDARSEGLGGWTMDVHHTYDPVGQVLYLGDGNRVNAGEVLRTINTVAGGGSNTGDGEKATEAYLAGTTGVAVAADGTFVISDTNAQTIRKVKSDGTITTIAGTGAFCSSPTSPCGDGGLATLAQLANPQHLAIGPDGSVYIADIQDRRVRKVDPSGIITTVAGNGQQCSVTTSPCGDGGPATQASVTNPAGVAVAPDGSLYIADLGDERIRKVATDGTIYTIAGTGNQGSAGDGGPASEAEFYGPNDVALGPDGTLYIADEYNYRVRAVSPQGIISTVAGSGTKSCLFQQCGDGGPAVDAVLLPADVTVGPDASVYIADELTNSIREVGTNGIITSIAGTGKSGFISGDAGPATDATLVLPDAVAFSPDNTLLEAEAGSSRIRRIGIALPTVTAGQITITSQDGNELYVFTGYGQHQFTLDALTGATKYSFAYDSAGHLASVTDVAGNVTTIQRDSDGNPTAIVAPGGQTTSFTLDPNGFLASIADPAGDTYHLASTDTGLLTSFSDPNGNQNQLTYDSVGLLTKDAEPNGGSTTLSRIQGITGVTVTLTTALNRTTTYQTFPLLTGQTSELTTDPAGATTQTLIGTDGSEQISYPDGSKTSFVQGPDPRWGMLAPVYTTITVTNPSGLTEVATRKRTATLADPNNLLSLQSLVGTTSLNGRTFTGTYNGTSRTLTDVTAAGRTHTITYDADGRVISNQLDPSESPILTTYDSLGRVASIIQGSQSATYSYDTLNRPITITDGLGEATTFTYDGADRVASLTQPGGQTSHFTYDADGNRTQVTLPSGATHTLSYTSLNQYAGYSPPGGGSSAASYDLDAALTQSTSPGGRTETSTYDFGDRPLGVTSLEAVAALAYAPGDPTDRVSSISLTPNGGGASQQIGLGYDADLISSTLWSGVAQGQYQYTYDNNFFLKSVGLTSGTDSVTTALAYDADGYPTTVGPFTLTLKGPGGQPSQLSDGAASLTLGYDTLARITSRDETVAGAPVYQSQLTFDSLGRLSQKVETTAGITHTLAYGYDANSQLTSVTQDGTLLEQYTYDANGNRTGAQLGSSVPITGTYDVQDRLTELGNQSYAFDADGFLSQRGTDTFQYGGRGELLSATVGGQTVTYSYDGLARRVGRTDPGGTTQYLYGNPANPFQITAIRDVTGTLTTLDYDPNGFLLALQRGPTRYEVATDQLGSPRVVADSSGNVLLALSYDSFGNVTRVGGSDPSFDLPIGFAGGLLDNTTGLVHFAYRDYDPIEGRWTARDPALFAGGQANLYVYVGNNPVSQLDPLGLFCFGGSAYDVFGGGGQVCITDQGISACAEFGVGLGFSADGLGGSSSLTGGLGGLASNDFGVGLAASGDCYGFGGGFDLTYSVCAGRQAKTKWSAAGGGQDSSGGASASPGGIARAFGEKPASCSVSGKAYIKDCISSSSFR